MKHVINMRNILQGTVRKPNYNLTWCVTCLFISEVVRRNNFTLFATNLALLDLAQLETKSPGGDIYTLKNILGNSTGRKEFIDNYGVSYAKERENILEYYMGFVRGEAATQGKKTSFKDYVKSNKKEITTLLLEKGFKRDCTEVV